MIIVFVVVLIVSVLYMPVINIYLYFRHVKLLQHIAFSSGTQDISSWDEPAETLRRQIDREQNRMMLIGLLVFGVAFLAWANLADKSLLALAAIVVSYLGIFLCKTGNIPVSPLDGGGLSYFPSPIRKVKAKMNNRP